MDINIDTANLRDAARQHSEAADYLRTVPATHAAIQDSLDSLGPIFAELREAGRTLLEQRRICYQQQADDHADLAQHLRQSAAHWELEEEAGAARVQAVRDERQ